MPFDAGIAPDEAVKIIDRTIAILSDPKKWCQRNAYTDWGASCIGGAFQTAAGIRDYGWAVGCPSHIKECVKDENIIRAYMAIWNSLPTCPVGCSWLLLQMFNDSRWTKHEDIMSVLQQARASLVSNGTPLPV